MQQTNNREIITLMLPSHTSQIYSAYKNRKLVDVLQNLIRGSRKTAMKLVDDLAMCGVELKPGKCWQLNIMWLSET